MPIGISTLCIFGRTFLGGNLDRLLDLDIEVLEFMEDWRDRLNKARIKRLAEIRRSRNIIYTIHSPLLDMNIASANRYFRTLSTRLVMASLESAREIDAAVVVVHPGSKTPLEAAYPNTAWEYNKDSLRRILAYAEDLGVKVGVENMPGHTYLLLQGADEFRRLADEGIPLKMTLDLGHANTTGQLGALLDMKDSIIHLHVHDNAGDSDAHKVVGQGNIDWKRVKANLSLDKITAVIESSSASDAEASLVNFRRLYST